MAYNKMNLELLPLSSCAAKLEAFEERFKKLDFNRTYSDLEDDIAFVMEQKRDAAFCGHDAYHSREGLDPLTDRHFEFCLTQVGRINLRSYSSVEIGFITGISPFVIACFVREYGMDFARELFTRKFRNASNRGPKQIIRDHLGDHMTLEWAMMLVKANNKLQPDMEEKLTRIICSDDADRYDVFRDVLKAHRIHSAHTIPVKSFIFKNAPATKIVKKNNKRAVQYRFNLPA